MTYGKLNNKFMIQIEKGIPLPEKRESNKYPLKELEIGDSFIAEKINRNSSAINEAIWKPIN